MTIQAIVDWTQAAILVAAPSLKSAPSYPSDKKISVPSSQIFVTNVKFDSEGGFALNFFDMRIEITIPRKSLDDAMKFLVPLLEPIGKIFTDSPNLGGTCQTSGQVTANLAQDNVADIPTIGYVFIVPDIKMKGS